MPTQIFAGFAPANAWMVEALGCRCRMYPGLLLQLILPRLLNKLLLALLSTDIAFLRHIPVPLLRLDKTVSYFVVHSGNNVSPGRKQGQTMAQARKTAGRAETR
jgi:hypothetical protein